MVTQKALPSTCPFTILFCHFSHQEVKSIPSSWIWTWLVNCFDQDEAKGIQCDFCAYALRDITVSMFVLSKSWVSRWKSQNSLACWREARCTEDERAWEELGPGSQACSAIPAESPAMSVTPASFLQLPILLLQACGAGTSHCHWPLATLQNGEQVLVALRLWVLRALSCCNRVWRGRVSRQGDKWKDFRHNPSVRWWADKYTKGGGGAG